MEFTHEQRRLLDLIYDYFDKNVEWPETKFLQRRLYQQGERKLQVEGVLAPLRPAYVKNDGIVGGRVRLTLRCLRETHRMSEINDFVCFLRSAVDGYGRHQGAGEQVVSAKDLAKRCSMDDHRLRKLDLLLADHWDVAGSARRDGDGRPADWSIRDSVWQYDDAYSIERYFELKEKHESQGTTSAAVAFVQPTTADVTQIAFPGPEIQLPAQPIEILARVEDPELRDRCADLLRAEGHFDRAVFQACLVLEERVRAAIGGPDLGGVALMGAAFSARAPRLRLSTDEREQRGAMEIYRGLMALLRNRTGHRIVNTYSREDAQRFVALVDFLLTLVSKAQLESADSRS